MQVKPGASNKAKIAKRVIEVVEFFDDNRSEATVMDIVRRYHWPQSSTSELLSSLVDLGLLYKDPYARSYRLTARAAMIGTAGQTPAIRDGSVARQVDRLMAQTGLSVVLYGMVGLNVQVVSLRAGSRCDLAALAGITGGAQLPMVRSAAGLLLLSTIGEARRDGVLRRLNAEAAESDKFSCCDIKAKIAECIAGSHAAGRAGFNAKAQTIAMLLPGQPAEHPLALGLLYGENDAVNAESLLACLNDAVQQCAGGEGGEPARLVDVLQTAAA